MQSLANLVLALGLGLLVIQPTALKPNEVKQYIKVRVAAYELQQRIKKENPPEIIEVYFKERNEQLLPKYGFTAASFDAMEERISVVYNLEETLAELKKNEAEFEVTLKELKANGISEAKLEEMRLAFKNEIAIKAAAYADFKKDLPAVNQYRRQIEELYAYTSGNQSNPPQL